MGILILWLALGLWKGVSCLIKMHALSHQPYNKKYPDYYMNN